MTGGVDERAAYAEVAADLLPWLSVDQMAEADRLAIDVFGIRLLQMMEHAGSALAELTHRLAPPGPVAVFAGGGNNGGGGLAAARHLVNRGRRVSVTTASDDVGSAARHHLTTLAAMGIDAGPPDDEANVVVDALVGYGLAGPLRGRSAALAAWTSGRFVVSLDFPSGWGFVGAVEPDATLTLALPKAALRGIDPLYLADLGLPPALWNAMGLTVPPLFGPGRILRVVP